MALNENEDWIRAGVAAAMSRNAQSDIPSYLEQVANFLDQIFPDAVARKTTGIFKKTLVGVEITFADVRLGLCYAQGTLGGFVTRLSRGIALKTEELEMNEWNEMLIQALEERASHDARVRDGMKTLLGL